jgi:DNA mismatch repair protein MutS2
MDNLLKEYKLAIKEQRNLEELKKQSEEAIQKELEALKVVKAESKKFIKTEDIKVGSTVKLIEGTQMGMVDQIVNKKAYVMFGNIRTQIPLDELEPVSNTQIKELEKRTIINFATMSEDFKPVIDLRGFRVDEALSEVETQLDKALVLGIFSLRILHGTGDGILRRAIREQLKRFRFVKNVRAAAWEDGGEGITILELE